jgi:nucleotide-binding universal stress UspA family protein
MAPSNTPNMFAPAHVNLDADQYGLEWPSAVGAADARIHQVVVGVDNTDASLNALRWATTEARRRTAELVIVHAWSVTPAFGYYPAGIIPRRDVNANAAKTLARAVTFAHQLDMPVTSRLIEGDPVDVLVHTAEHADLLVVGHPHHHFLTAALHHSTATRCARRASCPVVAVPADAPSFQDRPPAVNPPRPSKNVTAEEPAMASPS